MKIIVRIYKSAHKFWKFIAISTVALVLGTAVSLLTPKYVQDMVAVLESSGDYQNPMGTIMNIAWLLLAAYAAQAVLRFINMYVAHIGAWKYVHSIRTKLYNHLQNLSIGYYHDKQTGQLMARVLSDTNMFETLIAHSVPELVGAALLFVGVTVILFTTNVTLAAFTCIPLPIIVCITPLIKRLRIAHRDARVHNADFSAALQDNLSGIKEIQAFSREEHALRQVSGHSEKHVAALLRALRFGGMFHPAVNFFTQLGTVIVVGFGGYLALNNRGLEISQIVGFLMYLTMFYGPVST
ncbi:MAG: ABC transporter transmembrane domain-containing protein, partial [Clostridia bacterium]|nr:ABC transporter transmembrane domain-containing protein [Clostridia bacterium]